MKTRFHPFLRSAVLATVALATSHTHAATVAWVGDTDNGFDNANNWPLDTLPATGTDTWQINGLGSVNTNPILSLASPLVFTGTGGKIAFGASAPAMGISGANLNFFTNTTDAIQVASASTVNQTISSNIILGDGAAGTISLSNSSITGGLLKVTGNITGGSGAATPGIVVLSFGSTDSQDGNYEVTGNITKGDTATALTVTLRGDGTATLSGTNSFNTLAWGSTAGTIGTVRFNGGTSDIGSIKGSGLATQTLRVSNGTVNASDARQVRTSILVDGGTLNIVAGDRLGTNNAGQNLTISSGNLNHNVSGGFGVRLGSDSGAAGAGYNFTGTQSGGSFSVVGAGGVDSVFSLGSITAGVTTSYTLSGGTLDIKGNGGNSGWLTLGADNTAGTSTTTFTLSGAGKLLVRSTPGSNGINGKQAPAAFAAAQVFSMTGGTLVAANINATHLRGSVGGTNGTFVNNGGAIAPGDVGSSGKTNVSGGLTLSSGSLAIDLGGTTASTVFQDAAASGKHDLLTASGAVALGGQLNVSLIDSFNPVGSSFTILTGSSISGTFSNVSGGRVTLVGGGASFAVTLNATSVVLSDYLAGSNYSSWIGGFNVGGLTGPNDDYDADGLDNAVENVLGSDPSVSNPGLTSVTSTASSFKFRQSQSNTIASDVTKSYQWSTDLVEWKASGQTTTGGTTATISEATITDNAAPANDVIEVTVSVIGGPATKVFGRLIATKAP